MIRLFKYLTEKVPTQASQKEESNADSPSLTKGKWKFKLSKARNLILQPAYIDSHHIPLIK